jgi:stage V sporulation protein D (sporulation-specific penicillin-binding protein)
MTEKEQKKKEKDRRANRTVLWRTIFLMALFGVAVFLPLLGKLWSIQIVNHDYYQELAVKQQTRDATVSADRGTIYDANGAILAISGTVQNVVLSPRDVVELQESYAKAVAQGETPDYPEPTNEFIASNLAAILDVEEEDILERLSWTDKQYALVKSKVEEEVADQVLTFLTENHLSGGIYLQPDTKRYYPQSSLAAHIIGFVNAANDGAYGLEAYYNDELTGESGRVVTAKNAKGTEMLSHYENYFDAVDGEDFHLTIDATIQSYLESTLLEGIAAYDVQYGGFAIAMDPNTGAILGMASYPDYDLNDPSTVADETTVEGLLWLDYKVEEDGYSLADAQLTQWRNKALNDAYEPGSTFKALVLAAALEEGVVSLDDTFYCPGYAVVADRTISCSDHDGHGSQTLAKAVENSCNPAFIAIGQRLGAEKFYEYLERYGLLGTTGLDIPGEGTSNFWSLSDMGPVELATASFGQRFTVTPIQLITAISSVINGGHLMEPYVVESTTDDDGNVIYQHQATEVRQVVSESTSEIVRTILEGVVDGGTGKNAYVAGYRIGGKTGTSETTTRDEHNIVSFVGFAPANDPQVIVLLAYDGPKPSSSGSNYTAGQVFISGGNMAAPMAGQLIANILDYMGVQKQYTADELSEADATVPKVTGNALDYAQQLLADSGFTCRTVGEGTLVRGQIPAAGAVIPGGSQVVLYLDEAEIPTDQVETPDLTGLSPDEARSALSRVGLYLRATGAADYYSGSYQATSQSIDPGTLVDRGTVLDVRFVDGSVQDYGGTAVR